MMVCVGNYLLLKLVQCLHLARIIPASSQDFLPAGFGTCMGLQRPDALLPVSLCCHHRPVLCPADQMG